MLRIAVSKKESIGMTSDTYMPGGPRCPHCDTPLFVRSHDNALTNYYRCYACRYAVDSQERAVDEHKN